jgi:hypothetical protein
VSEIRQNVAASTRNARFHRLRFYLNIAINFARDSTPSFRKTEFNCVLIVSTLSLSRLATAAQLQVAQRVQPFGRPHLRTHL